MKDRHQKRRKEREYRENDSECLFKQISNTTLLKFNIYPSIDLPSLACFPTFWRRMAGRESLSCSSSDDDIVNWSICTMSSFLPTQTSCCSSKILGWVVCKVLPTSPHTNAAITLARRADRGPRSRVEQETWRVVKAAMLSISLRIVLISYGFRPLTTGKRYNNNNQKIKTESSVTETSEIIWILLFSLSVRLV